MFLSFPECLVQQATFGSTPSTLILSYLNHGIATKVWHKNIINTVANLHIKLFEEELNESIMPPCF